MDRRSGNQPPSSNAAASVDRPLVTAFLVTLALLFVASFFTHEHWWGLAWWGYFPLWLRVVAVIAAASVPWLINKYNLPESTESRRPLSWGTPVVIVMTASLAAFAVLRTRMHLLGDGFQLLSRLAHDAPPIRPWNPAVYFFQDNLYALLGGGGEANALVTFRLISWVAGLLFMAVLLWVARRSFVDIRERLSFVLLMAAGGQSLLFFGYVENYPLFVALIAAFVMFGWIGASGGLARGWAVVPLVLAAPFHPFTAAMLPAVGYLALRDTPIVRWYDQRSPSSHIAAWAVIVAPIVAVLYWFQSDITFLRFAMVPWVTDRFTVEGYTLLSGKHLADWFNLLFMLAPPLLMYLTAWTGRTAWTASERHAFRFLLLAIVPSLALTFIFDPKLGMARDWDIFAFAAIPLNLAGVCLLVKTHRAQRQAALLMAGVLSVMVLAPRVLVQAAEPKAVAYFSDVAALDPAKNRAGWFVLIQYYEEANRTTEVERIRRFYEATYPQDTLAAHGRRLFEEGKVDSSETALRRTVLLDPTYSSAWANLGVLLGRLGQHDSAQYYLRIADGLNPYNTDTYNNLGMTCFELGQLDEAERWWKKSWALNKETFIAVRGLLSLYEKERRKEDYVALMSEAAENPSAPASLVYGYADFLAASGRMNEAVAQYRRALAAGLDSSAVRQAEAKYPGLRVTQ